jgi:hypothetical protein
MVKFSVILFNHYLNVVKLILTTTNLIFVINLLLVLDVLKVQYQVNNVLIEHVQINQQVLDTPKKYVQIGLKDVQIIWMEQSVW